MSHVYAADVDIGCKICRNRLPSIEKHIIEWRCYILTFGRGAAAVDYVSIHS